LLPKKTKTRAPKRVLVGTATIYDEKDPAHQNKEIETIPYHTFANRKYKIKRVTVLKGTGIYFDPENPDHEGQDTEEISAKNASGRVHNNKPITVLKGTGILFNPEDPEHEGKETEEIKTNAASSRLYNKKPVTVLKGTGIRYDETAHRDQVTETIPYSTFNNRAHKMRQPTQPPATPIHGVEVLHPSEPSSSANQPIRVVSSNPNTLFNRSSSAPENPIERRLYRAQEVRQKKAVRLQKSQTIRHG